MMRNKTFILSMLAILVVLCVQGLYILATTNQILFEELLESVRSPYWLSQGRLFNTISRHVGWYAQLNLVYSIFGFSLYAMKAYRLGLTVLSMISIFILLKPYLKIYTPLFILIWGLSPTLLYFTAHGGDYGLDSQQIPIMALLLFKLPTIKAKWQPFFHFLFFFLLSSSIFTFSTFFFYIPAFLIGYWSLFKTSFKDMLRKHWNSIIGGVILPPILVVGLIQDGWKLFSLPGPQHLNPNLNTLMSNLRIVFRDIFEKGYGYNYILPTTEFSHYYPFIGICLIMVFLVRNRRKINTGWKTVLLAAATIFFTNLVTVNYLIDVTMHPGARRNTPAIFALYMVVAAGIALYAKSKAKLLYKALVPVALVMLLFHHVAALPDNYATFRNLDIFYYNRWFGPQVAPTPQKAFDYFVDQIQAHDVVLQSSSDDPLDPNYCRYEELYSALQLYCHTRHIECHNLMITEKNGQSTKILTLDYWNK